MLGSLLRLGSTVGGVALKPVASGLELGTRAERELRGALTRRTETLLLAALDALLLSPTTGEAVDRILASGLARRAVDGALAADGVLESALDSPAMERLVVRAIEGQLLNEAVERLLQSDELWLMVDEIARSPSVTEAITRQSASFVDEVAGGVRVRSRRADDLVESRVRRAFRRKQRAQADGDGSEP
jgi:hypothetical protein